MSTTTTRHTWSNRATWTALGLWGAIHVIGGASLLAASQGLIGPLLVVIAAGAIATTRPTTT